MDTKKYALSCVVVYLTYSVLSFLIHQGLLAAQYAELQNLWRPDMESKFWIHFLTAAVWSILFTFIYTKGYEGKGLMEGFRYGLWIGLFTAVPMAYDSYAVYPIPYGLALSWFIYGTAQCILCGVVLASVYRPAKS